tara:strand:- start:230 stop:1078 length:849 start_codon:yes stop_codon:yes gene_type:complete
MLTCYEHISQFYEKHKKLLHQNYPGIKLKRLVDDFCEYYRVSDEEVYLHRYSEFFYKILEGVPLEYINKNAYFYRSSFYVDERVLIPRSETEILVEDSIKFVKETFCDNYKIAEVGVGSFVIGLSLMCELDDKVFSFVGGDISEDALNVAKVNLFRHKNSIPSQAEVALIQSDRLERISGKYHFIVSNPPYIKRTENALGVHSKTLEYEPDVALFIEDDEFYTWFDHFFKQVFEKLLSGGAFFMEGHEDSLGELKTLGLKYFKKVIIKKDYTNRPRFLYAYK